MIVTRKQDVAVNVFIYFYNRGSQSFRWSEPNPDLRFC